MAQGICNLALETAAPGIINLALATAAQGIGNLVFKSATPAAPASPDVDHFSKVSVF
jgi:hypothetical protein